jgi:hypothetical protein
MSVATIWPLSLIAVNGTGSWHANSEPGQIPGSPRVTVKPAPGFIPWPGAGVSAREEPGYVSVAALVTRRGLPSRPG